MATSPNRWIWGYIRKYLATFITALLICGVVAGLSLVNPFITGRIVDEVFQQGNHDALKDLLLIMVAITFVRMVLRYTFVFTFERASQAVLFNMRRDIYRRIQVQSFSFFDSNRVGDIMSRMTGDLEAIRHFVAAVIYMIFENVLIFFTAILLIFSISWQMAALFLAFAPIIGACAFLQSKEIKPKFSLIREQFSRLNTVCQENISGNRVVKAFTQEDFEINKFTTENQAFWQRNVDSSKVWAKYLPILEIFAGLLGLFLLLAGGILVILDRMELWQMVTINGYLWAVYNPMRMLGWLMNDTQRFVASLEKVFDMMRQKIYIVNPENAIKPGKIKGGVEFKNVWFNYDRNNLGEPALKNISFKIEPGKTLGIVGATGSGKTTLINLIGRYYDVTEGEILVDGVNVKKYELFGLRRNVAIASQDVFLFSDTVEGNIVYGVPDAPMETVYKVAAIADADGFIKEMEDGYDTIIGERGVGLSGGQKQRLSLARAVAVNPSILILDDTTSAVDMETEHSIQASLKETKQNNPGMSIFIIAHRISSVKSADLILVLDKGEIIERGTHDELVGLKGYYYNLFMNQYGDYKTVAGSAEADPDDSNTRCTLSPQKRSAEVI